jgi:hypothetical protein
MNSKKNEAHLLDPADLSDAFYERYLEKLITPKEEGFFISRRDLQRKIDEYLEAGFQTTKMEIEGKEIPKGMYKGGFITYYEEGQHSGNTALGIEHFLKYEERIKKTFMYIREINQGGVLAGFYCNIPKPNKAREFYTIRIKLKDFRMETAQKVKFILKSHRDRAIKELLKNPKYFDEDWKNYTIK